MYNFCTFLVRSELELKHFIGEFISIYLFFFLPITKSTKLLANSS